MSAEQQAGAPLPRQTDALDPWAPSAEFECAFCSTGLEPGMDTIIEVPGHPGVVFCDRCEPLARMNLITPSAPPVSGAHRRWLGHVGILAALIGIAAGAVLAVTFYPR